MVKIIKYFTSRCKIEIISSVVLFLFILNLLLPSTALAFSSNTCSVPTSPTIASSMVTTTSSTLNTTSDIAYIPPQWYGTIWKKIKETTKSGYTKASDYVKNKLGKETSTQKAEREKKEQVKKDADTKKKAEASKQVADKKKKEEEQKQQQQQKQQSQVNQAVDNQQQNADQQAQASLNQNNLSPASQKSPIELQHDANDEYKSLCKMLASTGDAVNKDEMALGLLDCYLRFAVKVSLYTSNQAVKTTKGLYDPLLTGGLKSIRSYIVEAKVKFENTFLNDNFGLKEDGTPSAEPTVTGNNVGNYVKALTDALMCEYSNKLNGMIKHLQDKPDEATAYFSCHNMEFGGYLTAYKDLFNLATYCADSGVATIDMNRYDLFVTDYKSKYATVMGISNATGIDIDLKNVTSDTIDTINAKNFQDVITAKQFGKDRNLGIYWLYMFANSAVYQPFQTDINDKANYQWVKRTVLDNLQEKYGTFRKPLYHATVENQVENAIKTFGKSGSMETTTLRQFLGNVESDKMDVALYLKRDSLAEKSVTGAIDEIKSSNTEKDISKHYYANPTVTNKDYTLPVYLSSYSEDIPSWAKTQFDTADKQAVDTKGLDANGLSGTKMIEQANTNYVVMQNNIATVGLGNSQLQNDMDKPIYMDIYGNITSYTGVVIVPAVSNACFYNRPMLPLNTAMYCSYPNVYNLNGVLTSQGNSKKPKFMFTVDARDLYEELDKKQTEKVKDKNSKTKTLSNDTLNHLYFMATPVASPKDTNQGFYINKFPCNRLALSMYLPKADEPFAVMVNPLTVDLSYISKWYENCIRKPGNVVIHMWNRVFDSDVTDMEHKVKEDGRNFPVLYNNTIVNVNTGLKYSISQVSVDPQVKMAFQSFNWTYVASKQTEGDGAGDPMQYSNGVLRDTLMLDIAFQVNKGSVNPNDMIDGFGDDNTATTTRQKGLGGVMTATLAGIGESFHKFVCGEDSKNILMYVPTITELPLISTLITGSSYILRFAIVFALFGLLISYFPLRRISLLTMFAKMGTMVLVILILTNFLPTTIRFFYNGVTQHILNNNLVYSVMKNYDNTIKGTSTEYFDKYNDKEHSERSSYLVYADLDDYQLSQQLNFIGYIPNRKERALDKYLFTGDNNMIPMTDNQDLCLLGNHIIQSYDSLYNSAIIDIDKHVEPLQAQGASYVSYILKQSWRTNPTASYFIPFYAFNEALIYDTNTLMVKTFTSPVLKNYRKGSDSRKSTNFMSTYVRSKLFTQPDVFNYFYFKRTPAKDESEQALKMRQLVIDSITNLGDSYDFLHLFDLQPLPTIPYSAPFDNKDFNMEKVKKSFWCDNDYYKKVCLEFFARKNRTKNCFAVINGLYTQDHNPVVYKDNEFYIPAMYLINDMKISIEVKNDTVCVSHDDRHFKIPLGSKIATLDGHDDYTYNISPFYVENGRLLVPSSFLRYFGATIKGSSDKKFCVINMHGFPTYGDYGTMVRKIYDINDHTRKFIFAMNPTYGEIADDSVIKTISLYASTQFCKEFTTTNHKLSPTKLSIKSSDIDSFLKTTFIPLDSLNQSEADSLYRYTAKTGGFFAVTVLFIFEIIFFIFALLRDYFLALICILLIFFYITKYLFGGETSMKMFKGVLGMIISLWVINLVPMIGSKLSYVAINSNSNIFSSFGIAIGINVLASILSLILLIRLILALFSDITNLGATVLSNAWHSAMGLVNKPLEVAKDIKNALNHNGRLFENEASNYKIKSPAHLSRLATATATTVGAGGISAIKHLKADKIDGVSKTLNSLSDNNNVKKSQWNTPNIDNSVNLNEANIVTPSSEISAIGEESGVSTLAIGKNNGALADKMLNILGSGYVDKDGNFVFNGSKDLLNNAYKTATLLTNGVNTVTDISPIESDSTNAITLGSGSILTEDEFKSILKEHPEYENDDSFKRVGGLVIDTGNKLNGEHGVKGIVKQFNPMSSSQREQYKKLAKANNIAIKENDDGSLTAIGSEEGFTELAKQFEEGNLTTTRAFTVSSKDAETTKKINELLQSNNLVSGVDYDWIDKDTLVLTSAKAYGEMKSANLNADLNDTTLLSSTDADLLTKVKSNLKTPSLMLSNSEKDSRMLYTGMDNSIIEKLNKGAMNNVQVVGKNMFRVPSNCQKFTDKLLSDNGIKYRKSNDIYMLDNVDDNKFSDTIANLRNSIKTSEVKSADITSGVATKTKQPTVKNVDNMSTEIKNAVNSNKKLKDVGEAIVKPDSNLTHKCKFTIGRIQGTNAVNSYIEELANQATGQSGVNSFKSIDGVSFGFTDDTECKKFKETTGKEIMSKLNSTLIVSKSGEGNSICTFVGDNGKLVSQVVKTTQVNNLGRKLNKNIVNR